jgi:hypothetical protein
MNSLEQMALMATLSQVAHQLTHYHDNCKNPALQQVAAALVVQINAAVAKLAAA